MFSLEMCYLLNYSFCFYSAIEPTFVLELRASYTAFCTLYPRGAPGVRFYTPESPGANFVNGGGFPSADVPLRNYSLAHDSYGLLNTSLCQLVGSRRVTLITVSTAEISAALQYRCRATPAFWTICTNPVCTMYICAF